MLSGSKSKPSGLPAGCGPGHERWHINHFRPAVGRARFLAEHSRNSEGLAQRLLTLTPPRPNP